MSSFFPPNDKPLRIAVDMDEVIADSLTPLLAAFNSVTRRTVTPEEITLRGLHETIGEKDWPLFDRIPFRPGFFAELEPVAGSVEALEWLNQRAELYVVTAAMDVPPSFADKYDWLLKHFPFLSPQRFVFCGDKSIIAADYLIDDRSRHFKRFQGTGILFSAPHNARDLNLRRVHGWPEAIELLKREASLA